ncbi:MAG: hypothetical protein A2X36_03945 [Elusimicrobia bacterium GWA2_69_24]|nr:MAG: hypothetical protein A2X36_03945 [Elusimicrobia bacterium GWA2_69_24]
MIEPTGDRPEDWMKRTNDGASLAHYNELIAQREAQVQKEMADTKPPMPPPGYRPLMAYAFAQPGEYRIQAVYDDVVFVRPRLARIDSLPMLLRLFLELSCEFIGPERTIGDLRSYRVHAESPILGFTVKR